MGMRKKTTSAKDMNGPKRLPGSDSVDPHLKLKLKPKKKRGKK